MKHDLYEPERYEGCAACRVCGGAEGTLTTDCPGAPITYEESEAIYAGQLDYKNGKWESPSVRVLKGDDLDACECEHLRCDHDKGGPCQEDGAFDSTRCACPGFKVGKTQ